jgi:DNA-binding LacI/PurR family transcriptional regulator
MAQLNYIPNRVAQQLAGKQSLLIGVATSSLALHAPSQIVAAIKSRADQLGASVVVSMVVNEAASKPVKRRYITFSRNASVG